MDAVLTTNRETDKSILIENPYFAKIISLGRHLLEKKPQQTCHRSHGS